MAERNGAFAAEMRERRQVKLSGAFPFELGAWH